jgi:DNA-binding NarL/FixJ family response regulator
LLRTLIAYPIQAYLTKDLSGEQFLTALFIIAAGGTFFSPTAMAQLQKSTTDNEVDCPTATLTQREQDLFHLLCQGTSFRTIANQLHLSEQSARNYASQIYQKLGVASKSELMARYRQIK